MNLSNVMFINIRKLMLSKLIIILILLNNISLFSIGSCDNSGQLRLCLGNSLVSKNNSYQNPQYVDVLLSNSILSAKKELTFEMWMKPEFITGVKQYIAGIWGPSQDFNDMWVIYYNTNNELVFEINNPTTNQGDNDNLKVTTPVTPQMNNQWLHIAATFNGNNETIQLFINGNLVSSVQNTITSLSFNELKSIQNNKLTLQLASANAISNSTSNRSFKGAIDEVRLWNRVLNPIEISCQKDLSLEGNEQNLQLYYRFNESPNTYQVCDVSNKGNTAFLRSGANLIRSDRPNPRPFKIVGSIPDTIKCNNTQKFTFTITDTSLCGSRARLRIYKGNEYLTTTDGAFKTLPSNVPIDFSVDFNSDLIGGFDAQVVIERDNRCGGTILNINKKIFRQTQISIPLDTLELGILKAKCVEERSKTLPIKVFNTSSKVGMPQNKQIVSYSFRFGNRFTISNPSSFPANINADNNINLDVTFNNNDVPGRYYDTLYIITNDNCLGRKEIALSGTIEDVVELKIAETQTDITDLDFGDICIDIPSFTVLFTWYNVSSNNITIESIKVPNQFQMSNVQLPLTLESEIAYREKFIRFYPNQEGVFSDSIVIILKAGGCTVRRVINVKGRGIDPKVKFVLPNIDFGDVIIGQEVSLNIEVENYGITPFNLQFDLANGDAFFFSGGRNIAIPAGQKRTVTIVFRPTLEKTYIDELRLYEPRCFKSEGIELKGRGIIERFGFLPELMSIENVMACKSQLDTIIIENKSSTNQNLVKFVLDDPSGKFQLVQPVSFNGYSKVLTPNEKLVCILNYTPNDITIDRSDRAFIRFETNDAIKWNAKLLGTSLLPKIYVTDNNVWGTQEVGQNVNKIIVLENISSVNIFVDSVKIREVLGTGGFNIINQNNLKNKTLTPRDTLQVIVSFNPISATDFTGFLDAVSSSPCQINNSGSLSGKGRVIPLEVITNLLSYGFVNPCDCAERKIPLVNNSTVFPATINNISIVTNGDPNSRPNNFRWQSDFSPTGTLPYQIPARLPNATSIDTLRVLFCPKSPSVRDSLENNASLIINASGNGWNIDLSRYLAGKQNLFTEYWPPVNKFPDTRVDVFSAPQNEYMWIPDIDVNPDRTPLIIDSITFSPNDRVFFASDSAGKSFPLLCDPSEYLTIKLEFKPRAVRFYEAKMKVHFRQPCFVEDTTIYVSGWGFAPAFGLKFRFDDGQTPVSNFQIINCDTLEVPVYTSRKIPANYVNINSKLSYSNANYNFIGVKSDYLNNNCSTNFLPNISSKDLGNGRVEVNAVNFCQVDSIKPIYYALFEPIVNKNANLNFNIDSIKFDTEDVILYEIIAESSTVSSEILDVDYEILNNMDFGSVRILDCSIDSISVQNTGDVNILISSLIQTHKDISIINSSKPLTDELLPNEILKVVFEFCPTQKYDFDEDFITNSNTPCEITKSENHIGSSYAPILTINPNFDIDTTFVRDFVGNFNDTINVPIYLDKNFSANYKNTEYWLEEFQFDADIKYNKTALQFLEYQNLTNGDVNLIPKNGDMLFEFRNLDSLRKGNILNLKFKIMVPDVNKSQITTKLSNFGSTKILFLDLQSNTGNATIESLGQCAIDNLIYTNLKTSINQNSPNPFVDLTKINFTVGEKIGVKLYIYNDIGQLVKTIFDGSEEFELGNYEIYFHKNDLPAGIYFYNYENGLYSKTNKMIIE